MATPHSGHSHNDDHEGLHTGHAHRHEPEPGAKHLVRCPVMPDNLVNVEAAEAKGLFRDYEGQRYWFCCADCPPLWDEAPARYANAAAARSQLQ
jgi:YHS domain-containing protein